MRDPVETGESLNLQNLHAYWEAIDAVHARVGRLPDPSRSPILTSRKIDLAQPAGPRTYMTAERYIGVAMDNHRAMLTLMEHHGVTPSAPWSLMRPVFECGFFASWILDPADGLHRRHRGLRCDVQDEIQQRRHLQTFKDVPEVAKEVAEALAGRRSGPEAVYRQEATALGMKWETATRKVQVVDELKTLSFVRGTGSPEFMEATWRMLSGYEHGLAWSMLRGSDMTSEIKVEGGYEVVLTINDDAFVTASKCALALLLTALRRLEQLSTSVVRP